jgi:hypothetical protein
LLLLSGFCTEISSFLSFFLFQHLNFSRGLLLQLAQFSLNLLDFIVESHLQFVNLLLVLCLHFGHSGFKSNLLLMKGLLLGSFESSSLFFQLSGVPLRLLFELGR